MTTTSLPSLAIETLSFEGNIDGSWRALLRIDNETEWHEAYTEHDRVALVSGLYGPGAMMGWYLTMSSIAVKWLLHPRKKSADSLDIDLVTTLMLPSIASVDFILQARSLLSMSAEQKALKRSTLSCQQFAAAMQAPFDVLEVFMLLGAVLFIIALAGHCYRRGLAVATTILLCFTGECYLHFSNLRKLEGLRNFKREWSLTHFGEIESGRRSAQGSAMDIVTATLPALLVIMVCIQLSLVRYPAVAIKDGRSDIERRGRAAHSKDSQKKLLGETKQYMSALVGLLVLLLSIIMSIGPSMERMLESSYGVPPWTVWDKIKLNLPNLVTKWLPASPCSISDLDQAVAALSGATVLAFSIYGVGKAHYHVWKETRKSGPCTGR